MAADEQGNDLGAVGVPITGLASFAPVDMTNRIAEADLGASPLVVPAGHKRLGLYKTDGGPQDGWDTDDAIEFFQKGYTLSGDGTRSVQISVAEDNDNVLALTEGIAPDENGIIKVSSSLPDNLFILLVVTRYRNGKERRREGVASLTAVEPDQEERGSVAGKKLTFTWQENDLFDGSPFWQWGPAVPGSSGAKTGWTATISGAPTGGTFTLVVNGSPTAHIAYNAAAADVAAAINALSGVTGISGVTATGSGPYAITFPEAVTLSATSALTGGASPAITVA